jgi:hypothetical protein
MDFSDLPKSARDRIAAAELEAEELAKSGGDLAKLAATRAKIPWLKPGEFHQTLFEVAGQDNIREGRKRAAVHLFSVAVGECLKADGLDIETFSSELDAIGAWVCERFQAGDGWLPTAKQQFLALAYRTRAAALEAGEASMGTIVAKLPAESLVGRASNDGAGRPAVQQTRPRLAFVQPILAEKGWSILDWANNSSVDFNTANNYLKGTTNPYASTRKKLADSLGVAVKDLPL